MNVKWGDIMLFTKNYYKNSLMRLGNIWRRDDVVHQSLQKGLKMMAE